MKAKASADLDTQEKGTIRHHDSTMKAIAPLNGPSIREEWTSVLLLIVLYMMQGIPLGLSMGSMPFLMRSTMSYTKIGIFTLAAYPYSFKLLWSPLVDTCYFKAVGRRKSWIIPLQITSATLMITTGGWLEARLAAADAVSITALFFGLVMLAATQDIAVDGWALTLLSKHNVGFAATCQTVGMNIGYFSSFTVFLALSDPGFCAGYLGTPPGQPMVTLKGYLRFWGWVYLAVTAAVAVLKNEHRQQHKGQPVSGKVADGRAGAGDAEQGSEALNGSPSGRPAALSAPSRRRSMRVAAQAAAAAALPLSPFQSSAVRSGGTPPQLGRSVFPGDGEVEGVEEEEDIRKAYAQLWRVVALPSVRLLACVLMVARLGMLAAESAAPLKLLEKGVSKEALAGLVLVEFPVELVSAVVAGRWAASSHPLKPYFTGYKFRLTLAASTSAAVYFFPKGAVALSDAPGAFAVLAALGVATSFSSTLMFTALGDFFNRVSDPAMGGAYLTLLNTLANVGVVVPKLAVFAAIDYLTSRRCAAANAGAWLDAQCGPASAAGVADGACIDAGGSCVVVQDGFYVLTAVSAAVGLVIGVWLQTALQRLEKVPPTAWRAQQQKHRTGKA